MDYVLDLYRFSNLQCVLQYDTDFMLVKAGLDAGFIPEADFTNVKRAFLESLNIGSSSDAHIQNHVAPGAQV